MNVHQNYANPMAKGGPVAQPAQPVQLALADLEANGEVTKAKSSFTFRNLVIAAVGVCALVGGATVIGSTVSHNNEKAAAMADNASAQGSYSVLKANSAGMRAWENGCGGANQCAPGLICFNEGKSWSQCRPDTARTCGLPDINDGCRGSGAKFSTCCAGSVCDPNAGPHYASCVVVDDDTPTEPPTAAPGACTGEKFCGKGTSWYNGKCVLDSMTTTTTTTTKKPSTPKPPTTLKPTSAPTSAPTSSPTSPPTCGTRSADVDNTGFATQHGKLRLDGLQLVDKNGDAVQLMGMSSHGLHWFDNCYTKESISYQVKHWGINVFRAAMYIGEGGYASRPELKQKVKDIVQWCKDLGIYVMIDWHVLTPGNPSASTYSGAEAFFEEMATLYKDESHVIYEIANEPNNVDWPTVKAYHDRIIPKIRAIDPETIIIAGTTTWSQDIHLAAANPVAMPHNVMYAFHFYAGTHMGLIPRVQEFASKLPIFVSEWGTSSASGDGGPYLSEAKTFLDVFNAAGDKGVKLSWAQWSYADKNEKSAALAPGACGRKAWDDTSCSGTFVANYIKEHVKTTGGSNPTTSAPGSGTSAPSTSTLPPTTAAPTTAAPTVAPPTVSPDAENPFIKYPDWYVNPTYVRNLNITIASVNDAQTVANLRKMIDAPSAYWLDVKAKVQKSTTSKYNVNHAHGILEDAKNKGGKLVLFMVYDLPNRDCHAKASNGQICCKYNADGTCDYLDTSDNCAAGLNEYQTTYIDPLADLIEEYQNDVPIVLVIEPDSLPNLATNAYDPRCGNTATDAAYKQGISYAVTKLAAKAPKATIYVDAAHGGWLGWENNANAFAEMIAGMNIAPYIRGFATNVANYQPTGSVACPANIRNSGDIVKYCSLAGKGTPCCEDACGLATQWNSAVTEINYVAILSHAMKTAIPGFDPKFISDTGRNGVPEARSTCSSWCNIRGAGIGQLPRATGMADDRIDALMWLKTPGESDGCTETLPDGNQCPRFDSNCAGVDSIGSQPGEPRAPEAGHWFNYQIAQLAKNAAF